MLRTKEFCKNLLVLAILLVSSSNILIGAQLNKNARIVGGVTTTIDRHPHIVQLLLDDHLICGGSILSEMWIITAAHCVQNFHTEPERYKVRAGTPYRLGNFGVTGQVEKIFIHSDYNSTSWNKDIAMLKLNAPLTGENIKPIKLATSLVPNNVMVSVTGWGRIAHEGEKPDKLKTVQMKKISLVECRKRYPRLTNFMLCAKEETYKGKCRGDSGGPMVYNSRLVGLVSWGVGCGNPKSPGVYTNVFYLSRFINNTMQSN